MDQATAAKYRLILYGDKEDTNPIPQGLKALHDWAWSRLQRFGKGGISQEMTIYVVMLWKQTTAEGSMFFNPPEEIEEDATESVEWSAIEQGRRVMVTVDQKPMVGEFAGAVQGWLKVKFFDQSEPRSFRPRDVRLASM